MADNEQHQQQTVAIHYQAGSSKHFAELPADMPVIRVAIDPDDIDENDDIRAFDVATNLGADLPRARAMQAVGLILHRLAHALLAADGFIVDLHDLEHPENAAQQPGGAS